MAEDKYLYEIEAIETMADEDRILIVVGTKEYLITKADFVKVLGGLNSDDYAKIAKLVIDGSGTGLLSDKGDYKSIANLFNTSQVSINVNTGLAEIAGYHTHLNTAILDKFTVNPETGELLYDGSPIGTGSGGGGGTYVLPVATTDTLGGVKIDNDTIKINDGVISADVIGNWASGVSYPVGYFVVYDQVWYECVVANSDTEWTESNWLPIGSANGMTINNWQPNTKYKLNSLVINETTIYKCNAEHTSGDTFDSTNWTAMTGAKGDKGDDGVSPIAKVTPTETGCIVTIIDADGTTTAELTNGKDGANGNNGTNGITPHIDETTKHWMIGEEDTGVVAEAISTVVTNAVVYTGTLAVDNWIGDTVPYTQEVTINGISINSRPYLYLSYSTDDADTILEEQKQWSYITRAVTSDNIITFYCYKNKPTIALNFEAEVR